MEITDGVPRHYSSASHRLPGRERLKEEKKYIKDRSDWKVSQRIVDDKASESISSLFQRKKYST
jgi:hypothetical protein